MLELQQKPPRERASLYLSCIFMQYPRVRGEIRGMFWQPTAWGYLELAILRREIEDCVYARLARFWMALFVKIGQWSKNVYLNKIQEIVIQKGYK